jgi:hypothetical protein
LRGISVEATQLLFFCFGATNVYRLRNNLEKWVKDLCASVNGICPNGKERG